MTQVSAPALRPATGALGPPWQRPLQGTLDELVIDSVLLQGNVLGDPATRPLWVYTPPGQQQSTLGTVYMLQGMTGQLDMWRNRTAYRPTVIELVDALFGDHGCPPVRVVFVDCWTSYGGSQFLDSPGTGRYHSYLCEEVVPAVDAHYPTHADAGNRAVSGKSSGGYGAMVTPMLRPDLFGALATHSGDALFEHSYLPDVRACVRALREHYEGSMANFWKDVQTRPMGTRADDHTLVNILAMGACYSAREDGSVELPFDEHSGLLRDEVWQRWLEWDPVRMAEARADALRGLRTVYIDAGTHDEYYLDLGAVAFRDACERAGVQDIRFELFDATHAGIEYRYPGAIEHLARAMTSSHPRESARINRESPGAPA